MAGLGESSEVGKGYMADERYLYARCGLRGALRTPHEWTQIRGAPGDTDQVSRARSMADARRKKSSSQTQKATVHPAQAVSQSIRRQERRHAPIDLRSPSPCPPPRYKLDRTHPSFSYAAALSPSPDDTSCMELPASRSTRQESTDFELIDDEIGPDIGAIIRNAARVLCPTTSKIPRTPASKTIHPQPHSTTSVTSRVLHLDREGPITPTPISQLANKLSFSPTWKTINEPEKAAIAYDTGNDADMEMDELDSSSDEETLASKAQRRRTTKRLQKSGNREQRDEETREKQPEKATLTRDVLLADVAPLVPPQEQSKVCFGLVSRRVTADLQLGTAPSLLLGRIEAKELPGVADGPLPSSAPTTQIQPLQPNAEYEEDRRSAGSDRTAPIAWSSDEEEIEQQIRSPSPSFASSVTAESEVPMGWTEKPYGVRAFVSSWLGGRRV